MTILNNLQDLKNIEIQEELENTVDKSAFRNYSKRTALTIGYLLGVKENYLQTIPDSMEEYEKTKIRLDKNNYARAIRHLNNLRSNLILYFKMISKTIRLTSVNYKPIDKIEYLANDFNELWKLDINISTGRNDIYEYIKLINKEINKRIDNVKNFFPEWVNFIYIKDMFIMPSDIEEECKKYQTNQNFYPYKRYFNWEYPEELGNILVSDAKILDVIYLNNGEHFSDFSKVIDASDKVKNNIAEFIKSGKKVQIFIDGENVDPYRFASTLDSLKDYELQKIDKIIVYYDKLFSSKAWEMLKHFSYDIKVESIEVERIKENKSLVDHKLIAGVSKACYKENVDSIILASSDSDFWSVIEDVDAKYLVLVESDKCGPDFKNALRNNNIFYCYIDKFMTPDDNQFFKSVFCSELRKAIDNEFKLPCANKLLDTAIIQSRAYISNTERENLYKEYIRKLKLDIDKNGNFTVVIPK